MYPNRLEMGEAAGKAVELNIVSLLESQEEVRMIFAAAPSQNNLLHYLRNSTAIAWNRVVAFHMDEYLGLQAGAAQLFSSYLKEHLFAHVSLKQAHFIDGNGGAAEAGRYARLLAEKPIDMVCLGIGENGHIAFNDPPVADFNDPEVVKDVALDQPCRQQQVNDGCFASIGQVPTHALTVTVPALMAAKSLYCVVPGKTKAQAVAASLLGPVDTSCPASILRTHSQCTLFLDADSLGDTTVPDHLL